MLWARVMPSQLKHQPPRGLDRLQGDTALHRAHLQEVWFALEPGEDP